jgi:hypothetical protein
MQVTRERIRQIEAKAIMKLRQPDRCAVLNDYVASDNSTPVLSWRAPMSKHRA